MNLGELFLIAVGLSMDAFAVSVTIGLPMRTFNVRKSLTVGLYFGIFQAVMPLIGYFAGIQFADKIVAYDHWIAFILLAFIGGKMIEGCFKKDSADIEEASLSPGKMLPLALATSIDALAMGVSFAFLKVQILPAVTFIGITTLIVSMTGVKIGDVFGTKYKSKAEFAGGIILVFMGFKILVEHLGIL